MGGVSETRASHLHLEVLSNTAQPGPSLPVTLLSPAWVSFLKVGEHPRAHSSLIYILPLPSLLFTFLCRLLAFCPSFCCPSLSSPALPSQGLHLRVLSERG